MARDFEITTSQQRALDLCGVAHDGTFSGAKVALLNAGLPEDGVPSGHTWRSAKKLSDDALRAAFGVPEPSFESAMRAARIESARSYVAPTWGDHIRAAKSRERQNGALRAAGYTWSREHEDNLGLLDDDPQWTLTAPDGRAVTVAEALAEIEARA